MWAKKPKEVNIMADKVLWKTGDTITADKLNGSSVFLMPVEFDEKDAYVMPDLTAKQVVDALNAGAQLEAVGHGVVDGSERWLFYAVTSAAYETSSSPATVTVVITNSDEVVTLTAEYPNGTFIGGGK